VSAAITTAGFVAIGGAGAFIHPVGEVQAAGAWCSYGHAELEGVLIPGL
jgi:hypothetical protein